MGGTYAIFSIVHNPRDHITCKNAKLLSLAYKVLTTVHIPTLISK